MADTLVPIRLPISCRAGMSVMTDAKTAMTTDSATTTVEWPSEKKSPTATGRCPSDISLRVVLSMAAMWSASTAWRTPKA